MFRTQNVRFSLYHLAKTKDKQHMQLCCAIAVCFSETLPLDHITLYILQTYPSHDPSAHRLRDGWTRASSSTVRVCLTYGEIWFLAWMRLFLFYAPVSSSYWILPKERRTYGMCTLLTATTTAWDNHGCLTFVRIPPPGAACDHPVHS